jgi:thiol-disulfide isomerase/thioredoxin
MGVVMRVLALLLASVLTARAGAVRVGEAAPDFTLPDGRGRPVSLADLRGRVVCVDFWASWCPPCRAVLPALDDIARRLGRGSLEIVAVSIDQERASADRFLAARVPAPAVRIAYDPAGSLLARFGAAGMPALYVIDRRGVVRAVEISFDVSRLREVERQLIQLLAEPAP